MDILFLSPADWNGPRGRFQQIAERLARHNRVLYVDGLGVRAPLPRDFKRIVGRISSLLSGVTRPDRLGETLFRMSPIAIPIPARGPVCALNRLLLREQITRRLRRLRFDDPLVWMSYPHPTLVDVLGDLSPRFVVYDIVDDWTAFEGSYKALVKSESMLIERSDLVLATSERLRDRASRLNPNTFLVPNGVDLDPFDEVAAGMSPPDDIRGVPHPRIGFVGNIAAWVDLDLVVTLARIRPGWEVVLVGPWKRPRPPLPRNVRALGLRQHDRIPDYITSFDVCLIPFLRNRLTESVDPVKLYEYLAAGKPVVTTPLPELCRFEDLVYFASDADETAVMIERALAESPDRARARRDRMRAHSWNGRVAVIDELSRRVMGVTLTSDALARPTRPINVLVIYPWTSFWAMGDGCGAESFYRAVHAYVEHGHRVRVLMPVIGPRAAPAKTDGVSIDSVPFTFDPMRDPAAGARGFASWMIRYARFQRVMTRAGIESARAFRPDIVVGMGAYAAPVARRVATAARVPNVTRLFGQSLGRHLDANGRVLDSVRFRTNVPELRAFRTPCSALVVHDDGARGDVVARRLGVADERFYYWRDGVSVTGVSNADPNVRRALGVPEQAVVAAYVGRLSVEKNLFAILEAFAYAAGEQADLHFVFVGDGPLRSDLEAAAARSHYPDRVHFAGAFPHERMSHMLPGIDILVSLSDRTNMTNATLEAMAAGLAVIALDAGDTATVVRDGETGVLIARESELAPALLRLARARELRRELGNRARALIAGTFESVEARLAREVDLVARIARRGRVHSAAER